MPPLDPRMQVPPGAPGQMPPGGPEELPPEEQPQEMQADPLSGDLASGMKQASPEEQEQSDRFALRALKLIYSENMFDQVVQMLSGGAGQDEEGNSSDGDPVHGLAMATDMIVARVAQMAEEAGEQLQPDAVYHAAGDVYEDLMEVSRQAGIKDYSQDSDAVEAGWFEALDLFRERLEGVGEIDKQSAGAGLERLKQADSDGTLEKIMVDLASAEHSGQAGGAEPPQEQGRRKPKGLAAAAGMGVM